MKFMIIIGTRPEIIKMLPIINKLKEKNIEFKTIFTKQHFSDSMSTAFFDEYNFYPDIIFPRKHRLNSLQHWLTKQIKKYKPNAVLVHGDTRSAFLGALASCDAKTHVVHVEAGLRTFNFLNPYPEEYYRTVIDSVSSILFCPTHTAFENVDNNSLRQKKFVVGNTIIDVVKPLYKEIKNRNKVLVTIHRRENWNKLESICEALKKSSETFNDYEWVFIKHANKNLQNIIDNVLKNSNIKLVKPVNHKTFVNLINESVCVISDSGSVVEEANVLKTPVLIVRKVTERYESVKKRIAKLIGNTELSIIYGIKDFFLENEKSINFPMLYGNGDSAEKIVDVLKISYGDVE